MSTHDGAPPPRRLGRVEPREIVELRQLKVQQPELAPAVDMQIALVELLRRVQGRLGTPLPQRTPQEAARRLAAGERLLEFDDLLIDWSEFRLIFRQTAEILHRAGALEASDQVAFQDMTRTGQRLEPLSRDYYGRTAHPDRYAPPPAGEPALIDEVLSLALKPFLARAAEAWGTRISLDPWQRGYCPLCGLNPDFSALNDAGRILICGRCTVQWPFPEFGCPFCGTRGQGAISSFTGGDGRYRIYGCNTCRKYTKAYDARGASRPVLPSVDTIATLPLDAAALQQGYDG